MAFLDRFRKKQNKEQLSKLTQQKAAPVVEKKAQQPKEKKVESIAEKKVGILAHHILVRPLMTEKAVRLQSMNQYTFAVAMKANKPQVKKAIEELYGVKPVSVSIMRKRGDWVRYGRTTGKRKAWKKATITLKKGDTLPLADVSNA